ncbi:patatin-like phospholipase family protein [bacterium]|nr:patatin-like phospholipase family protein [bacterium]
MQTGKRFCQLTIIFILPLLLLAGCANTPGKQVQPQKIALVLGGGGARGFAHVGVIRELEAAGIPIDMIVGVSVGSLIGALYADSGDSFQVEWKAFKIEKKEIFDFKVFNITDGLAKGDAIQTYVDTNIQTQFLEDMKIPLAIVAVDLNTGKKKVFRKGLLREAIRASISVPGVFAPVVFHDQLLVDGGVKGNLAPDVAREMGADIIIGVNIAKPRKHFSNNPPNALTVILESIDIMGDEIVQLREKEFDFMIRPDVGTIGITDFTQKKALIDAGRSATQAILPALKKALEK